MTVFPDKEQVSLTTHGDYSRVRADLVLPDDEDGYQYQYLDSDEWEPTESTLHYRDGEWNLGLGFRKHNTDTKTATENGTVLGVDPGVNETAVTGTERFFLAAKWNTSDGSSSASVATSKIMGHGTPVAHSTL